MTKKIIISILVVSLLLPKFTLSETGATQPCKTYENNNGYYFDDYEKHEYVNGFLVMHFRLKPPYNDGRGWGDKIFLYASDCEEEVFTSPTPGLWPRPGLQLFSIRFSSPTHYDIWDDELDVKFTCDRCSMDMPSSMSEGKGYTTIRYEASIDNYNSYVRSASLSITGTDDNRRVPTIIVPGITGSELMYLDQKIWPNLEKMILDPDDRFMDVLGMDVFGKPKEPNVFAGPVISKIDYPFGVSHYTDLLKAEFIENGFKENEDLFFFNYDWRLSIKDLSELLRVRIEEVARGGKVNIVAHSLGGLITKKTLASNEQLETKINKVVFVGVPNLGSAEAARTLVFGSNLNIPFLNPQEISYISQNMPSIYELLPSAKYFTTSAGWYDDLTNPLLRGILNYQQSKDFLLGLGKNGQLMENAENIHREIDSYDLSNKPYQTISINGCGSLTLKTISKMYTGNGTFKDRILNRPKYKVYTDTGDGTVLLNSSSNIQTSKKYYVTKVKHSEMLSQGMTTSFIYKLLNQDGFNVPEGIYENPNNCAVQGKLISLPSNLEIQIKNVSNNSELVPEKDYQEEQIGDDKIVFVPEQEQKVQAVIKPKNNVDLAKQTFNFNVTSKKDDSEQTSYYNDVQFADNTKVTYNIEGDVGVAEKLNGDFSLTLNPSPNEQKEDPPTPIEDKRPDPAKPTENEKKSEEQDQKDEDDDEVTMEDSDSESTTEYQLPGGDVIQIYINYPNSQEEAGIEEQEPMETRREVVVVHEPILDLWTFMKRVLTQVFISSHLIYI